MKNLMTLAILSILCLSACGRNHYEYSVGQKGDTGAQGPSGADAQPCLATSVAAGPGAPNGGTLISCPTTSNLLLNGTNGTDGTNGTNGAAGTPGTVITLVKLCPGTTVYPSTFIEVSACINNELVGVYSANGGFLTELPEGTYGSNGINASCNFVIGANCTVTH